MGSFRIRESEGKIVSLEFLGRPAGADPPNWIRSFYAPTDPCRGILESLKSYLLRKNEPFPPCRFFAFVGLTDFTRNVILGTRRVPLGRAVTYTQFARMLGLSGSYRRAVAQALGRNPLPIFFPCHRIVGSGGLGGYSSGPGWKRRLLGHEGVRVK